MEKVNVEVERLANAREAATPDIRDEPRTGEKI